MSTIESWIRFANIELPCVGGCALIGRFGSAAAVFEAAGPDRDAVLDLAGRAANRVYSPENLPRDDQIAYARDAAVQALPHGDPSYPTNLLEIPTPPPVLFMRGRLDERDRFAIGLVGTRRPSAYGRSVAIRLARDLAAAGLTVVSGGAMGVDAAVHRAALEAGGRTIVVLGCGLGVRYPAENQPLFEAIIREDQGAVISEAPLLATPEAWRFPARNRIISGLSMGIVVVEAGQRSGALITASAATEQGRDVMAVPGNIDVATAVGPNELIRDGAALVTSAADIQRVVGMLVLEPTPRTAAPSAPPVRGLPEPQQRILQHLSLTPRHIDALAADVRATSSDVGMHLTMLELGGHVRRLPGNCYIRAL